jgi:hypothetical protein
LKTTTLGITSSNLHIGSSPLLTEYDFRASTFYDGYMSISVMANKIASDMKFEEKLKRLYMEKRGIKNA